MFATPPARRHPGEPAEYRREILTRREPASIGDFRHRRPRSAQKLPSQFDFQLHPIFVGRKSGFMPKTFIKRTRSQSRFRNQLPQRPPPRGICAESTNQTRDRWRKIPDARFRMFSCSRNFQQQQSQPPLNFRISFGGRRSPARFQQRLEPVAQPAGNRSGQFSGSGALKKFEPGSRRQQRNRIEFTPVEQTRIKQIIDARVYNSGTA